jgi:hypothetical protein
LAQEELTLHGSVVVVVEPTVRSVQLVLTGVVDGVGGGVFLLISLGDVGGGVVVVVLSPPSPLTTTVWGLCRLAMTIGSE